MMQGVKSPRDGFIYAMAAALSLALSFWVSWHETVINPDAICYLYSAKTLTEQGLHAAMHICPQAKWPFYSALIALVSAVSPLDLTQAANALDALFTMVTVLGFMAVVQSQSSDRRLLGFAMLVILSMHQFNSVRQYIVRDHGFWAAYMLSLLALLRFTARPSLQAGVGFSLSLMIATLFRIEGALFLLLLPMVCFCLPEMTWPQRVKAWLQLNSLLLLLAGVACLAMAMHPQLALDQWGRFKEVPQQVMHAMEYIGSTFAATKHAIVDHVLSHTSFRDATFVTVLMMLVWYVTEIINNVSWVFALLVLYAWMTQATFKEARTRYVLVAYLVVNLLITASFFLENLFLAKRYLIALSLIFALWVPYALQALFASRRHLAQGVVSLAILATAISGIGHFGHQKQYIRAAGDWLAENVPPEARLYANDYQLMYYSKHFHETIFTRITTYMQPETVLHGKWRQFDYLAIQTGDHKTKTADVLQELTQKPVKIFASQSGDKIYIYKLN